MWRGPWALGIRAVAQGRVGDDRWKSGVIQMEVDAEARGFSETKRDCLVAKDQSRW